MTHAKVHVLINVIFALSVSIRILLGLHVCDISISLEFIASKFVVAFVSKATALLLDLGLSELNFVLHTDLAEAEQHDAHSFAIPILEFVRRHIQVDSKFLKLKHDVLRGRHWVFVLVPAGYLVVVHRKQPRDQTHEVDELFARVGALGGEVHLADWLEPFVLAEFVLVVEQL